jgi:hypothetical protein
MPVSNRLSIELLEDRLTPALTIQFDYRFDTSGFFTDPSRRALLERAGTDLGSRIDANLGSIQASGSNSWAAMIFNPATGGQSEIANLTVATDTIVVFVGSRNLSYAEAGVGGTGGYRVAGSPSWFNSIASRAGTGAFSLWGGSISFDSDSNWYFGSAIEGIASNQVDFYTVAVHELGHVLGFGTSTQFTSLTNGRTFTGANARAANGGVAPSLSSDLAHWNQGTLSDGHPTSMQPYLWLGTRYGFSNLDYAALADLGWTIIAADTPGTVVTPPSTGPGTPISTTTEPIVLTGTNDGLARIVRYINGQLTGDEIAIRPFSHYFGVLRSVTADVTGDGITDIVFATGAGGPARLAIVDGATGTSLINPVTPFGSEFTGGLFLATADFNNDGRDDIIVSPDQGGGGRVSIYRYTTNAVVRVGDFFGIEDADFRGGARVAAGDFNGDGVPDVVVGAGYGGGPRVALFDGRSLSQSRPNKFIGDFFAFPGDEALKLRNGVYVAAGDLNADGKADLVIGAGPGGGPHVYVLSGAKLLAGHMAATYTSPIASFFAFDFEQRGGVRVNLRDVNRDGTLDLVAGSGTSGSIAWFNNASPTQPQLYAPAGFANTLDGVYVG